MASKNHSAAKTLSKTTLALALAAALYPFSRPALADVSNPLQASPENTLILAANDQQTFVNAFSQYYSVCDAEILAGFWNTSAWDAKVIGGQKILNGFNIWDTDLYPALQQYQNYYALPPPAFYCYYEITNQYTYNDAEIVACAWQRTHNQAISVDQAKLVIGASIALRDENGLGQMVAQSGCA